jgi:hypothetical protein
MIGRLKICIGLAFSKLSMYHYFELYLVGWNDSDVGVVAFPFSGHELGNSVAYVTGIRIWLGRAEYPRISYSDCLPYSVCVPLSALLPSKSR